MTQNEKEFEILKQPLIPDENVRPVNEEDTKESPTCSSPEEELASTDQIYGAAWAGGISGLLVGGPIGGIVLAYAGVHFAKKNTGDVGNFCRKAGDFVCRLKTEVPKAWREAHPTKSNDTKTESSNAKH
jgi:hypothetical protein